MINFYLFAMLCGTISALYNMFAFSKAECDMKRYISYSDKNDLIIEALREEIN